MTAGAVPLLADMLQGGSIEAQHAAVQALQSLRCAGEPAALSVSAGMGNVERLLHMHGHEGSFR